MPRNKHGKKAKWNKGIEKKDNRLEIRRAFGPERVRQSTLLPITPPAHQLIDSIHQPINSSIQPINLSILEF